MGEWGGFARKIYVRPQAYRPRNYKSSMAVADFLTFTNFM
jgi:hypothetical protein